MSKRTSRANSESYWAVEFEVISPGKYAEAIASYNRFKEKKPGDMRADASIAECQQAHVEPGEAARGVHCARASNAAHWLSQVSLKLTVVGIAKVLAP